MNTAQSTRMKDVLAFINDMVNVNIHANNRDISILRWETAMDNHIPSPREHSYGLAVQFTNDYVKDAIVLFHDEQFGDNRKLGFFVDNGTEVKAYYNASWNESGGFFILHPLKSIPHGHVDMGPRKTYYLKVQPKNDN